MMKSSKGPGAEPEVPSGFWFQQMDSGQQSGDYIAAGQAQLELERLGWLIRRMPPRDRGEGLQDVARPVDADADAETDFEEENVEADSDGDDSRTGRPLGIADVVRLVGLTDDELDEAIDAGRFPLPDGYFSGRPYWDRDTIGWWIKRGTSL